MVPLALTDWIRFSGPNHSLELFGIRLVGINADNGKKLLFSVVLVVVLVLLSKALRAIVHGTSVPKGRAAVGAAGRIVVRIAARSSRTLEFRFTTADGKVTRVRIRVKVVKQTHQKG